MNQYIAALTINAFIEPWALSLEHFGFLFWKFLWGDFWRQINTSITLAQEVLTTELHLCIVELYADY